LNDLDWNEPDLTRPEQSMTLEDWFIVAVLAGSVIGGLTQGFFRSVFSLAGLVVGLMLAAWNYMQAAKFITPFLRIEPVADAVAFIVIALVVMVIFGLIGTLLHKTFKKMGLGCLDRLFGGAFGLLQGLLLVTLSILVAVAFFPEAHWLFESTLPKLFFGVCAAIAHVTPGQLADRLHAGLRLLEQQTPWWMHPNGGKP
jgi:membrane protein required for colicin V production